MRLNGTNHKIPKQVANLCGGSRQFRQRMRRSAAAAQKAMEPLCTLGAFTCADIADIRDVVVLLDRIARDLSQKNWGK